MNFHPSIAVSEDPSGHGGERTLARRIVCSELQGFFSRTLEVPLGQRAVLLDGGRYVATLPSGGHELEGWKRGASATAILVDDSPIPLLLGCEELASSDQQNLRVVLELGLRITTPEVFVAQRVRDRGHYTLDELRVEIGRELLWVVEELFAVRGAGELTHAMGKERLRLDLLTRWQPICERSGLLLERLAGLRVEAPDHAASELFEHKARKLRAEYELEMATLQGGRVRQEERLRRESLELNHDIESRRKVAKQKMKERELWFVQQRVEQTFARQEQMKKMWEMARIHEMHQERKEERLVAHGKSTHGGVVPAGHQTQGSFQVAKQREEVPPKDVQPPQWRRCPAHGIKYDVQGGDCPLCERERRNRGRG